MTIRSVVLALAVVAIAAASGTAQEVPADKPYAFFSPLASLDANKVPAVGTERAVTLGLRPNVEQYAYVFVYNPTDDDATVNVILSSGTKAVAGAEIARTAAPVTVPSKQVAKVALAGKAVSAAPAPAVAPADKDKPVVAEPVGQKIDNNSTLVLRVEKAEKAPKTVKIEDHEKYLLTINPPTSATAGTGSFKVEPSIPTKGKLSVAVSFTRPADGAIYSDKPAKVRLDLRPDVNTELDPDTLKQGTFEADLPIGAETGKVTLFAEGVKFKDKQEKKVRIAVSVDGYDRAFLIDTNFEAEAVLSKDGLTNVKLSSERQVPGKPVLVTVEAEDKATAGASLSVDRTGEGRYDLIQKYATARREAIFVKVGGPNDSVQLTPVVEDWTYLFDTKSVAGVRTFKVVTSSNAEATRALLVDRTAPVEVKLVDLPAKAAAVTATEHVLKASGLDAESGIADVIFYVGDAPAADGKPAPGGKAVHGVKAADGTWASKAPVRLPETRGEIKVGVRFVNGVGLTTDAESVLYVKDPEKEKAKEEEKKRTTGSIKGTVIQANRLQPDLPVSLRDGAGKELKKTTTNGSGEFTFKDVPPGEYTVTTVKRADQNAKGSKPVTVEAVEKPATVEVPVKR